MGACVMLPEKMVIEKVYEGIHITDKGGFPRNLCIMNIPLKFPEVVLFLKQA